MQSLCQLLEKIGFEKLPQAKALVGGACEVLYVFLHEALSHHKKTKVTKKEACRQCFSTHRQKIVVWFPPEMDFSETRKEYF